jgi:hypothetical protein
MLRLPRYGAATLSRPKKGVYNDFLEMTVVKTYARMVSYVGTRRHVDLDRCRYSCSGNLFCIDG